MTTLLILGAAVWPDGPSPTLRRRTMHAAGLLHAGHADHIIACGGLGKYPPSEAEVMRHLLIEAGIPEGAITCEDRSTNTAENIRNACALRDIARAIIITDAYHAPRARLMARRAGLDATTSSPPLRGSHPKQLIKSSLREIPAYIAYALRLR